jgi:hypothetical protein
MPTDLTVLMENRPGALADVGEALGSVGVNIEAVAGFGMDNHGRIHLVVDDADAAKAALKEAGLTLEAEREALQVTLDDAPGAIGSYARKLADKGMNIEAAYIGGRAGGEVNMIFVVGEG